MKDISIEKFLSLLFCDIKQGMMIEILFPNKRTLFGYVIEKKDDSITIQNKYYENIKINNNKKNTYYFAGYNI